MSTNYKSEQSSEESLTALQLLGFYFVAPVWMNGEKATALLSMTWKLHEQNHQSNLIKTLNYKWTFLHMQQI